MLRNSLYLLKNIFKLKPRLILLRMLLTTIDSIAIFINLILPKYIISGILNNQIYWIFKIIVAFTAFNILCAFINRISSIYLIKNTESLNIILIDKFMKDGFNIPYELYFNQEFFSIYNFNFNNICDIHHNVLDAFINLYASILNLFLITTIIKIENYFYIILFIFILLLVFIREQLNKYEVIRSEESVNSNRKLQYIYSLFSYPRNIRDMKLKKYRDYIFLKKDKFSEEYIRNYLSDTMPIANLTFISSIIINLEKFIIISMFSYLLVLKKILIEDFFVYLQAYAETKRTFTRFFDIYASLNINNEYIKKLINMKSSMINKSRKTLNSIERIAIKNLSFSYNSDNNIISNFSFEIEKNDRVLITGGNGKGKTTLLYLLIGLIKPKDGLIYFNKDAEINTFDFNPESCIGVQFQDTNIFPFKISENISLNEKINLSHIKNTRLFDNIYDKLDLYYSGYFADDGIDLSGGQKQLIGIMRAIYSNTDVVIFDEPFNNLDSTRRNEVVSYINQMKNNIVIVVTHDYEGFNYNKHIRL